MTVALSGSVVFHVKWGEFSRGVGLLTFPTAASPSNTSLTLLLGFGAAAPESVMGGLREGRFRVSLLCYCAAWFCRGMQQADRKAVMLR